MRHSLWLLCCFVAACGAAQRTQSSKRPSGKSEFALACISDGLWTREREPMVAEVERIRRLNFVSPVRVCVQHGAAMRSELERVMDDAHLRNMAKVYTALGLLEPSYDLRSNLIEVLGEQVVGFYDPDRQVLVVRSDVSLSGARSGSDPAGWQQHLTLVHELVHALQDQHFQVAKLQKDAKTTDAQNAMRALLEGDATLSMLLALFARLGIAPTRAVTQAEAAMKADPLWSNPQNAVLMRAPLVVRESLLGSYRDGFAFALWHYRAGGFREINQLYRNPPETMAEVLHPEQKHDGGQQEAIMQHTPDATKVAAQDVVWDDSMGEFELQLFLRHHLTQPEAMRAAAQWQGDRLLVFEEVKNGLSWQWVWSIKSPVAAKTLQEALKNKLKIERNQNILIVAGLDE